MFTFLSFFLYYLIYFSVDYPYPASFLEPLPGWPIKVRHAQHLTLNYQFQLFIDFFIVGRYVVFVFV